MITRAWRCLTARAASLRPEPVPGSAKVASTIAEIDLASESREWMVREGFKYVVNPIAGGYTGSFDPKAEYQFMREGWEEPHVFRLIDCHPMFNLAGLHFREIVG